MAAGKTPKVARGPRVKDFEELEVEQFTRSFSVTLYRQDYFKGLPSEFTCQPFDMGWGYLAGETFADEAPARVRFEQVVAYWKGIHDRGAAEVERTLADYFQKANRPAGSSK